LKPTFVLVAVGDKHVGFANLALRYLKRFTRSDIVVVTSRSAVRLLHDQVIEARLSERLNDQETSILIKTNLPRFLGRIGGRFCYLDTDVIAVSDEADSIFRHVRGPVAFAPDNVRIDVFSRHAMNCSCSESTCNHLREGILCDFGVDVTRCDWTLWNGGVFVFGPDSGEFFSVWHSFTLQILSNTFWRTRDQGTLAAAVWKLELQDLPTLPRRFNFIVDRYWGVRLDERSRIRPERFCVWRDYSLSAADGRPRPAFLHFVNGGVQQTGWSNWDEVAALLDGTSEVDSQVPKQ